jgi:hypothetical protein
VCTSTGLAWKGRSLIAIVFHSSLSFLYPSLLILFIRVIPVLYFGTSPIFLKIILGDTAITKQRLAEYKYSNISHKLFLR